MPPCEQMCLCELDQYAGDDLRICQTVQGLPGSLPPGFCYIDPSQTSAASAAEAALVENCPASQKRLLRFLGADTPARGATTMIACSATAP